MSTLRDSNGHCVNCGAPGQDAQSCAYCGTGRAARVLVNPGTAEAFDTTFLDYDPSQSPADPRPTAEPRRLWE